MKADNRMAKLPGLFQRAGVYQLRVVIPSEVRPAYSGKAKIVQSLGTTDLRQAKLLATEERSKLLQEFEGKRVALSPQRLDRVTPEMALELAQRVRATVLRVDDILRDQPKTRAILFQLLESSAASHMAQLTISGKPQAAAAVSKVPADSLAGLSVGEATALASLNEIISKEAGVKLALRNLQAVLPLVKEEAYKLGLAFDPHAPGAREALQAALKAYRQAWQEVTQRDAGEVVDTPAVQPLNRATAKPTRLRDVYLRWKDSKPRGHDSHLAVLRSIASYEEFTGDPPLLQLTRSQGDAFRTWLQHPDRKTTSKTARDKLTWVKSVLNYACRDLELIPKNPWEGLDIAFKTTSPRRPWTEDELKKFFTQDLYTGYALPKDKKAGADAAYWIPILGFYSGARIGELAQLRVVDVEDAKGAIPLLSITEEGEGQTVKSSAGIRKVPIHSELVRLGFLDYVQAMRSPRATSLWPDLRLRKEKPGDFFGRWFSDYRSELGFGEHPDFHCIRHTVRTQLAEAEIGEPIIDTLVGHEVKGSTGARTYTHRSLAGLRRAVETLHYPALKLKKVYKAPT